MPWSEPILRTFPAEERWLIALMRWFPGPGRPPEPDGLDDWPRVLDRATEHGLTGVVQAAAGLAEPGRYPAAFTQALIELTARGVQRTGRLLSLLGDLLAACSARGIRVLPFRGPLTSRTLYGDTFFRHPSDLDLLINGRDLPAARETLGEFGLTDSFRLSPRQEAALVRYGYERVFRHDAQRQFVDLHWRCAEPVFDVGWSFEAFWERRVTVDLGGLEAPTLSPEDLLLFFAIHGARHIWDKLSQFLDIRWAVEANPGLDWPGLLRRAGAAGRRRMLLSSLLLARTVCGAALPEMVEREIEAGGAIVRRTAAMLGWSARLARGDAPPYPTRLALQVGLLERPGDALRAAALHAAEPTILDIAAVDLPVALFPLYYGVRAIRLLVKHAGGLLRRAGR